MMIDLVLSYQWSMHEMFCYYLSSIHLHVYYGNYLIRMFSHVEDDMVICIQEICVC